MINETDIKTSMGLKANQPIEAVIEYQIQVIQLLTEIRDLLQK